MVVFGSFAPSLITFRAPLIKALVARGHEVIAMAPGIDADITAQIRALGARARDVRLGRASLDPRKALRTRADLTRLFREVAPDTVIAYTITPIVLGAPVAAAAGIPNFVPLVTGLGYAFTGGREPKRLLARAAATLLYWRAFRASRIAIFQNEDDRAEFRRLRLLPKSLPTAVVRGSGVDLAHYAPAPVPEQLSFLMIARFLKDKGLREFGEAAARLKQAHPHVPVRLVGWLDHSPDAISADDLARIEAAGVEVIGRLADVRPAIAAHAVYVLPSYREGTPRSVLEAMALGRAVITTDAPGCRDTVEHDVNGLLVPPRDADALHRAMLRFVEEPGLAQTMGRRSRERVERLYDADKVAADLLGHAGL